MTQVLLVRHKNGELQSCSAIGHSGFSVKGSDIVCAAITTLLRTTLEVLENSEGIRLVADVASRGSLAFTVKRDESEYSDSDKKLIFAGDFLELGLKRLMKDYPSNVTLQVQFID